MDDRPLRDIIRHLHQMAAQGEPTISDAQLLQRFVAQNDEVAFELLLRRHGPMVRGVCRRLLHDFHNTEDAFQATFLTLVRKASAIGRRESLSAWLYRVAYRIALRALSTTSRLPVSSTSATEPLAPEAEGDLVWRDLRPVLDEEINRLPARYSMPVILCYFQGLTHEQAARELGCPKGTVAVRLLRARKLLHARLTRRGLALSVPALVTVLTEQVAQATLPAATVHATLRASVAFATGSTAEASIQAVTLTEGVLRTMMLTKIKATAAVILLAAGILSLGVGLLPWTATAKATTSAPLAVAALPVEAPPVERPADVVNIPVRRDGIILFLGTEIKDGEKVPAEDVVRVKIDGKERRFRQLKVGDKVEDGQLIGMLDDDLAHTDVKIRKAKLEAAEADRVASENSRDEAYIRYRRLEDQRNKDKGSVPADELGGAELTWKRYKQEEIAKRAAVRAAEFDVIAAMKVLSLYEIRAARGEIKGILKRPREAIREYETVVQIRVDGKPPRAPAPPKEPVPPEDKEREPRAKLDKDSVVKLQFALGDLAFRGKNYRMVDSLLRHPLHADPPLTTPEAMQARRQLAESCNHLAEEIQQRLIVDEPRPPEETKNLQQDHRRWLLRAADEYSELARFLDKPESAGHLNPEDRMQIPFVAAMCHFNLGEYATALDMYEHLADVVYKDKPMTPPPANTPAAALVARYPEFRLKALACVVRCHAALGHPEKVRMRLEEMRQRLPGVDGTIREEYEKWISTVARSVELP